MKDKNECGSNGQNSVDNVALQESFGRSTLRSEFDGKYESTRYLSERRREYSGDAKRRQRYPCAVSTLTEIDAKTGAAGWQDSRMSTTGVEYPPGTGIAHAAMSSKFIIDSMLPKYHQQFHHQQLFASGNPSSVQTCSGGSSTASLESSLSAAAVAAAAVNYAHHSSPSPTGSSPQHSGSSASTSPAARTASSMYPYVSAAAVHHHHQQQQAVAAAAFGASSSMVPGFGSASSAALAAAAAVDAATGDKSCRYTASLTGNVAPSSTDPIVNYNLSHHHQNGATPGGLVSSAPTSSAVSAASASMAAAAQFYHQAAAASVVDPLTSCQQPTAGQPGIPDIPRYPWIYRTHEQTSEIARKRGRKLGDDDVRSLASSVGGCLSVNQTSEDLPPWPSESKGFSYSDGRRDILKVR
ncbi:hypothetical protein PV325_005817 [Microctonus aethiopoides]|nr:hypothetical protein PV325_005817 [Microctonus aethiopoides]